jgi:hypothetical protein
MNELQAKLARRREMNGEAGLENKIESTTSSSKYVPDPKSIRVSPKNKSPTKEIIKTTIQPVLKPVSKDNAHGSSTTTSKVEVKAVPVVTGKLSTHQLGKLINVAALDPLATKPLFLSKQKPQEESESITIIKESEIVTKCAVEANGEVNHVSILLYQALLTYLIHKEK